MPSRHALWMPGGFAWRLLVGVPAPSVHAGLPEWLWNWRLILWCDAFGPLYRDQFARACKVWQSLRPGGGWPSWGTQKAGQGREPVFFAGASALSAAGSHPSERAMQGKTAKPARANPPAQRGAAWVPTTTDCSGPSAGSLIRSSMMNVR